MHYFTGYMNRELENNPVLTRAKVTNTSWTNKTRLEGYQVL